LTSNRFLLGSLPLPSLPLGSGMSTSMSAIAVRRVSGRNDWEEGNPRRVFGPVAASATSLSLNREPFQPCCPG
jgi:hypothetical protein